MWDKARPIEEYYKLHAGESYSVMQSRLTVVATEMAAYGDWTLYEDADGNYWESYFSIGD